MKNYYCKVGKKPGNDFLHRFAREFCVEGFAYRAGDAVNFAIGQGDTVVTPLQLARAYGALANGGTLYEPRVAKAIVSPDGKVIKQIPPKVRRQGPGVEEQPRATSTTPCRASPAPAPWPGGSMDFPLDKVTIRAKTGSAEVYGKQSTSWVASYDQATTSW